MGLRNEIGGLRKESKYLRDDFDELKKQAASLHGKKLDAERYAGWASEEIEAQLHIIENLECEKANLQEELETAKSATAVAQAKLSQSRKPLETKVKILEKSLTEANEAFGAARACLE